MLDFDRSNFIVFLEEFPSQIQKAQELLRAVPTSVSGDSIRNVVLVGMGGSAIAGDLLASYASDQLSVPCLVHRNYDLPRFVDSTTLIIALSYSGNTEETLTAFRQALQKKAQVLGISSGGELEQLCLENNCLHVKVPGGHPPRQALGYLFFSLLFLFQKMGYLDVQSEHVEETIQLTRHLQERLSPNHSYGNNLANHIAQSLYHTIPVIYAAVPYFYPVAVRWRNQFNENSKMMAFSNVFPELNHNEIMGWEGPREVNKHFRVIILRDREESPENQKRVEITKEILKRKNVPLLEVFSEGQCRLSRLFSLIYTGDWVSYYLAMINEKDPIRIDSIDLLKEKLKEN